MLRRLLRRGFGFLKSSQQRNQRSSNEYFVHEFFRDSKAPNRQQGAISIDLSQLKLDHLPDHSGLSTDVPQLEHGLDKFLNGELVFGDQGVGDLPQQDDDHTPNPQLEKISNYVEPSKDTILMEKGSETKSRYISSTSSISSPLGTLYYIFSCFRTPQMDNIYEDLPKKPNSWMISSRKPTSFFLHPINKDCDAIVSDKGPMPAANQVLMNLGHVVQYFLTHTRQQTDSVMKGVITKEMKNYYRYAKVNNQIMLRSQIDCMSYDKNGKPYVFQIKSRACAPIRYDVENYKDYKDYEITTKRGLYQSFQRQYFDLIRGGFLKYVMQVKIGKMDGAFIAYHNTEKIYGYEYVKIKEMALRAFGDQYNLDVSFVCVSKMLTVVLDHVRKSLPQHKEDSLKIGFYSEYKYQKLTVMVEAMSKLKQYTPLKKKTQQVKTVTDYYTHIQKVINPVYKFQFDFFIYVNGVRLENPEVLLTPHDSLQIKYRVSPKLNISTAEYLTFLNQCYKDQDYLGALFYRGHWNSWESPVQ